MPRFIDNADAFALNEMKKIDPALGSEYARVIEFLAGTPGSAPKSRSKKFEIGSK